MIGPDEEERAAGKARRARTSRALNTSGLCVASNLTLAVLKLLVGFFTHSVAILSDGMNSACDLVATALTFMAIMQSGRPPDQDHPWGHGKYESLAGMVEATVIFLAGGYVVYDALREIGKPDAIDTGYVGILVMVFSTAVNTGLSRWVLRVARQTDSIALRAEGQHILTDVVTSAGVLSALILSRLFHIPHLQAVAALMVSVFIFRAGYKVAAVALAPLLDTALPPDEMLAIHKLLKDEKLVLGYHNLRTRRSGAIRHIDLHVMLPDEMSFVEAHRHSEMLEQKIQRAFSGATDVIIHAEPYLEEIRHQEQHHGDQQPEGLPEG